MFTSSLLGHFLSWLFASHLASSGVAVQGPKVEQVHQSMMQNPNQNMHKISRPR
jgi:hypothetical protein